MYSEVVLCFVKILSSSMRSSCLGQTCLNARSVAMLEEHEEGVDDELEVWEQRADEDKGVTCGQ